MFQHILLPLDGSRLAECVLPHALAIAQAFDAQITLLQVLDASTTAGLTQAIDPIDWQFRRMEAQSYLTGVCQRLEPFGVKIAVAMLDGRPAVAVTEFMQDKPIDLVILSSHGQSGLSSWNVSSVVQKIIATAPASIMLIRAYEEWDGDLSPRQYTRILVPLDGSRRAECVLPLVARLGEGRKAIEDALGQDTTSQDATSQETTVIFVHAVRKPEMPRRAPLSAEETELVERITERNLQAMTTYLEELQRHAAPHAETRLLVTEDVAESLHELTQQENADLVVMSAHGYSGRSLWPYGSLTTSFIAYGTTPLIFVQDLQPGESTPTRAELASREQKGH